MTTLQLHLFNGLYLAALVVVTGLTRSLGGASPGPWLAARLSAWSPWGSWPHPRELGARWMP
jgi:hypothetical protein